MKKLNRKGFTLIELLAIIVILAIIMVVTIPTVLSSMGNARQSTFETSANTVADWAEKNYALVTTLGEGDADAQFKALCTSSNQYCKTSTTLTANFLQAAGVSAKNYDLTKSTIQFNANGRVCVILEASTADGSDFKTLTTTTAKSVGCTG